MAEVMILAAGLGTRLRPLTLDLPKPLVPVGAESTLEWWATRLMAQGFTSAVLNAHHLIDEITSRARELPFALEVSPETEILGTAGGVARARKWLQPPAVVINADVRCEVALRHLLERVMDGGICLAVVPRPCGEGTVGLDRAGEVVRLRGERFGVEASGGDYCGVLALGADCLSELPARGCLVGDYCLPRLRAGGRVKSFPEVAAFQDIGTLEDYVRSNFRWLAGYRAGAPSPRDSGYVSPSARSSGAVQLLDSIVGEGAEILGSGAVRRCIVWPGARLEAPLQTAIVTHTGRVVPFDAAWAASALLAPAEPALRERQQ